MESTSDTTILAWKFDHVDRNKDMVLQRNETNILKNLVKQQIQPRSCAKNFIASCSNGDQQISKSEWLDCLRVSSDVNRESTKMKLFSIKKSPQVTSTFFSQNQTKSHSYHLFRFSIYFSERCMRVIIFKNHTFIFKFE